MAGRSIADSRYFFVLFLLLAGARASAAPASVQAPLADASKAASVHAPYGAGACSLCHATDDPAAPGPLRSSVNALCLECHTDFGDAMAAAVSKHEPAVERCTNCHNPHDAPLPKLLSQEPPGLCFACHQDIYRAATTTKVEHGAVTSGRSCLNCHTPHAANVEKLLTALPYDLCVGCHSGQSPVDTQGKELTNFAQLLAQNPYPHGPVAAKDCSACHFPHGGDNFRLLVAEYPAAFYAPFQPANYALCFSCHNDQMVAVAETTTLTGFRDGARNLHFVHVHKEDRGRTCRACHEVHAAPQPHLIRNSVPYGSSGWSLKVNFVTTATGGTCEKTCHGAKTYDRTAAAGTAP